MRGINIIIKDELKQELEDFATDVSMRAAKYVRDLLTTKTYEAFERYYFSYQPVIGSYPCNYSWQFSKYTPIGHPIFYVRTFNVLTNKVIKGYYENKHGKIMRGGVQLLPENMEENYNISASSVFANISSGYHGLPEPYNDIPDMKPSPETIVNNERKRLINNPEVYSNYCIEGAKLSKSYSYLYW